MNLCVPAILQSCMHTPTHVCLYMCTHVYTYAHLRIRAHEYSCMHTPTYACACAFPHASMHACIHPSIRIGTRAQIHAHVCLLDNCEFAMSARMLFRVLHAVVGLVDSRLLLAAPAHYAQPLPAIADATGIRLLPGGLRLRSMSACGILRRAREPGRGGQKGLRAHACAGGHGDFMGLRSDRISPVMDERRAVWSSQPCPLDASGRRRRRVGACFARLLSAMLARREARAHGARGARRPRSAHTGTRRVGGAHGRAARCAQAQSGFRALARRASGARAHADCLCKRRVRVAARARMRSCARGRLTRTGRF